jgi:AraC family transcriptional regulator
MNINEAHISSISRAIDFVEANLQEEITLADVADAVHYSLFHFCRMFNGVVHHTPYEYLMRRRLSESARDLILSDKKVIEIAFDYQFNSPETYTRAFKRMFAMQPSQWRKRGTLPTRALMPCLTEAYLFHLNQGDSLKPVMEKRGEIRLAGLMTHVKPGDDTTIRQLWEAVIHEVQAVQEHSRMMHYGVCWYPDGWENVGWYYLAALEIPSSARIPAAFVVKTLPEATYACFQHHGGRAERQLTLDYVYHTWLPKSGNVLLSPIEIEVYGAEPPYCGMNSEGWKLWLPLSS